MTSMAVVRRPLRSLQIDSNWLAIIPWLSGEAKAQSHSGETAACAVIAAQSRPIATAEITQSGNTALEKKKPFMIGAVLSLPESVRGDKPFVNVALPPARICL